MADVDTPDPDAFRAQRAAFAERMGIQVESTGWMPRMSGRVLGLLIVSEAPLTQSEIRDELGASAGAISSSCRELIAKRLAQRVSIVGQRQAAMELHPAAWRILEEDGLRGVQDYAALAKNALGDFAEGSIAARNLMRTRDYFAVVEQRMLSVLEWLDDGNGILGDEDAASR